MTTPEPAAEPTTEPDAVEATPEVTDQQPEVTDQPEPEPDTPHSREARYRQQLRAVEAERDQLREGLERRDRADVERLAASKLADPGDIWRGGIELADVMNESGELDPDLVSEAITRLLAEHPHWERRPYSPAAPASSVTLGAGNPHDYKDEDKQDATWQKVFQAARGVGDTSDGA